ncbi:uncharacterized protein AB675_906 [Cyphellophora attinorum]|uniref:Uncharacterized protein n=1 Tax=Cyphellophora attinorum TaxID=1664694 RepID=A0A0N0NSB1_9EURO|nr:uncharacterized protein AB675_906 [Phialophora attinorum]KPI45799.1 hypothetical protein AB675_906 [Phialophora attinorum]
MAVIGFYNLGSTAPRRIHESSEPCRQTSPPRNKGKAATHKGPKNFDLMRLPAELRLEVYKKLLPSPDGLGVSFSRSRHVSFASAAGPNRQYNGMWRSPIRATPSLGQCEGIGDDELSFPGHAQEHGIIAHDDVWLFCEDRFGPLLNFAKASHTTRDEVMPILNDNIEIGVQDLSIACWYSAARPFFTHSITAFEICAPLDMPQQLKERWLTQLFTRFPSLDILKLTGIHAHKAASIWGTRYKLDDLRMMKFVLDNSRLQRVGIISSDGTNCAADQEGIYRICHPFIAFATEPFQCGAGVVFSEIDCEAELKKGMGSVVAKGTKRKRRSWALQRY